MKPLHESELPGLPLLHRGKVRDVHVVDDQHVLIVATDRLSAFDVVLPDPIPGKGEILTQLSNFWFEKLSYLGADHRTGIAVADVLPAGVDPALYCDRSVVARRLEVLPIEAVVRGYLIGSGWRDYRASRALCGIDLPAGLMQADRLAEPVFTPATKAAVGDHDQNISFAQMAALIGIETADAVRQRALAMYGAACAHAAQRGILIADTKFEFALDPDSGDIVLVDEALTPDSSRFWDASTWAPGSSPPSYDKQPIRDYLETLDWDKTPPGPRLPPAIIADTAARYRQVLDRLRT